MGVLPIRTGRLVLRVMKPADAAALTAYRNDAEVARFQDWSLPYTDSDAQRLLDSQAHLEDIDPDGWTQVAIEHEGEVVGDLAVGLETARRRAELGYTLAPRAQHRGFAVEAAGALIDALFARTETRRIVASLDDANRASMRVIETLGLRFEGVARRAVRVRGEWQDDTRFAILRDERAAWVTRDRTPAERVELVELVDENADRYARLATHRYQEAYVAPMAQSFCNALLPEEVDGERAVPWFRGVVADAVPVGFVMLAQATDAHPDPYLWRLLIDRWHQRRGIGEHVVTMLADRLREQEYRRLLTSWGEGPGSPEPFYLGLGFVRTGKRIAGEVEGALAL